MTRQVKSMFESKNDLIDGDNQYTSAKHLLNQKIHSTKKYCLFLDIDGTISEFHPDPQKSFISAQVLENISALQKFNVDVVAVTGRAIQDAQRLFDPIELTIAGTHGLEIQFSDSQKLLEQPHVIAKAIKPENNQDFDSIYHDLKIVCVDYPKLRIEKKQYAIALHFRENPELQQVAHGIILRFNEKYPDLQLNSGKCVYELILKNASKGVAIKKIYQHLALQSSIPIFLGDDRTDESGFDVINQLNGISIKVGEGKTQAKFRIKDVNEASEFIHLFKEFITTEAHQSRQSQTVLSLSS